MQIAVWLERFSEQGLLRKLGIALNSVQDANTLVAISWTERGVGSQAMILPERVPIIGRTLNLNLQQLPEGDYSLAIVVQRPGTEPVRVQRKIVLKRAK